jgi:hypothetical protein
VGDPGLPIMAGVLAVPVGVLLLVLLLALMGRRWVLTGPDTALTADYADYDAEYEYGRLEPAPYRPALEAPRHASSTAYDAYGSGAYDAYGSGAYDAYGSASQAHGAYESGRDAYAAPSRETHGGPVGEPYALPRPSEVSDWEPYVPARRRPQETSSRSSYESPADSYGAAGWDPYVPPPRHAYGSAERPSYAPPAAQNEYPNAAGTHDRPEPSAYPDPWHLAPEDRQRFPYGPYGSR